MGIGIERLAHFRERISQIENSQSLLSEARRNALKFDACTGLTVVGMTGLFGTLRLLERHAISPNAGMAIFMISFALAWDAPYGWLLLNDRSAVLQEQAKKQEMLELPRSLSERTVEKAASFVMGVVKRK